jgi:hypothetical protein
MGNPSKLISGDVLVADNGTDGSQAMAEQLGARSYHC